MLMAFPLSFAVTGSRLHGGRSVDFTERQPLGISKATLDNWFKKAGNGEGANPGVTEKSSTSFRSNARVGQTPEILRSCNRQRRL